ncbi:hypothetical protein BT69DRAFT_1238078 [Atractiella rhizophila]|nr:hypothetical protein BT69DRAFT_1238078 [Atractiella rhizophila]
MFHSVPATPPPTHLDPNVSVSASTLHTPASGSRTSGVRGAPVTPQTDNKDAFPIACDDMAGKYVTLAVEQFIERLPQAPKALPQLQMPPPEMSGSEKEHYGQFTTYMAPFINPRWKFHITSAEVDRDFDEVGGVQGVKPDVILYDDLGENRTVMKKAVMVSEFKTADLPFLDKDGKVVENHSDKGKLTRGQLILYSTIVLSAQQRTRSYSFFIRKHTARIICHSRAGMEVSPLFNYVETSQLREFFWRYTHASAEDQGFDTTMISDFQPEDEKLVEEARVKLKITKDKPLFKVFVQGTTFYISEPFIFRHNNPTGRGTRCFEAYYPAKQRLVLLKDTWRHVEYVPEGEIYEKLHAAGLPNILPVVAHGDVDGKYQSAEVLTEGGLRKFVHYRLVLGKVGRPIGEFRSSYELVKGCADAFEAHFCAWKELKMLHRDVSSGNIILGPIDEEPQGYLIDWEFAKEQSAGMKSRERTGTYEFMSVRLLQGLSSDEKIQHEPSDDIESFIYVLAWTAIQHAVSGMDVATRQSYLNDFMRQPWNDVRDTIKRRNAVITGGAAALRLSTAKLSELLKALFLNLSYRLRSREELIAELFDASGDLQQAQKMADVWIGRTASHHFISEKLKKVVSDEEWRKLPQDAAQPLRLSSKRKLEGGAVSSGTKKQRSSQSGSQSLNVQ